MGVVGWVGWFKRLYVAKMALGRSLASPEQILNTLLSHPMELLASKHPSSGTHPMYAADASNVNVIRRSPDACMSPVKTPTIDC